VAERCIKSAALFGVKVQKFWAVPADEALPTMNEYGLRWAWRDSGQCTITGLQFHRYGGGDARVGCALSHYLLWRRCAAGSDPVLILEHDAVFIAPLPDIDFMGICQINDPRGATPKGDWWSDQMAIRGTGVFPKTYVLNDPRPDGLAGNSAYMIKPEAAQHMVDLAHRVGLWPNDALMCRQLVDLQELYPFVTRVKQEQSTTNV
jgi:hypothetical protein